MARGRKKGGLKVNEINDNEELIKMIINQINSLNKKIKKFKEKDVTSHLEFVKSLISEDMGQFTINDTLSKSKKFYKEKNIIWLKKTLKTLHKINNHYAYGTEKKYFSELTKQMERIKNFVETYLRQKGYSEEFIQKAINSKDFYVKLFDELQNVSGGYGSKQAIDKVALNYDDDTGITDKEKNRILNNIEFSRNTFERLNKEQQDLVEFRNSKRR